MPQVSVIIPTYKHCDFLLETLESVFAQTFTDYEVIVVNDGSPDDTAEVLRPFREAGRIRYIEQENQGQAAARNWGLAEARGQYLAFLDDDDLWPPDKLEWQVEVLKCHPQTALVYGDATDFSETISSACLGPVLPNADVSKQTLTIANVSEEIVRRNWIKSPGQTLIRTKYLRCVNGFDPAIWGADDWDVYIRLSRCGLFAYERREALRYRLHANNASKSVERMYANFRKVHHKYHGPFPTARGASSWYACDKFIRDMAAQGCITLAENAASSSDWKSERRMRLLALRINPASIRNRRILLTLTSSLFRALWPP